MSLEDRSNELKDLVSTYDTLWFLGHLSELMPEIGTGRADDELGGLSSPLRQLYFLGGLLITSDSGKASDVMFTHEKWNQIVDLLNQIEREYDKLFFPQPDEEIDEEWKKIRTVAIPSFLSYFNQGPLNFEEQSINWVRDLFSELDSIIEQALGLKTEDFIQFYENIDVLVNNNRQSHFSKYENLRPNWEKYTRIKMGVREGVPDFIKEMGERDRPVYTLMADHGIINRFYPEELMSDSLPLDKVKAIIKLLSTEREKSDYLYYTETKPGNPLYEKPIVDIDEGMYQVFEVKQIIHAVENLLEDICSSSPEALLKLINKKGKLLEEGVVELFKTHFKKDYEVFTGYYVDGYEQDILFLWEDYAFIIETKGYHLREPFRDPSKAFVRIKDDFDKCIGYGYSQTCRVEQKFIDFVPLRITDNRGGLIKEIDTKKYQNNHFSIIVNLKSFGQIQTNLSTLLEINAGGTFPWAVRLDDLEVFLLTLVAQKKAPYFFINYLLMREHLHGKLICSDELQVCGGFMSRKITIDSIEATDIILTKPELAFQFDEQYKKGMGFKNEKDMDKKTSGKYIIF